MRCSEDCPGAALPVEVQRMATECEWRKAALDDAWVSHAVKSRRRAQALEALQKENEELRALIAGLQPSAAASEVATNNSGPPRRSEATQVAAVVMRDATVQAADQPQMGSRPPAMMVGQRTVKIQTSPSLLVPLLQAAEERAEQRFHGQVEDGVRRSTASRDAIMIAFRLSLLAEARGRAEIIADESFAFGRGLGAYHLALRRRQADLAIADMAAASRRHSEHRSRAADLGSAESIARSGIIVAEAEARSALWVASAEQRMQREATVKLAEAQRAAESARRSVALVEVEVQARMDRLRLHEEHLLEAQNQLALQRADIEAALAITAADAILSAPPPMVQLLATVPSRAVATVASTQTEQPSVNEAWRTRCIAIATARTEELGRVLQRIQRASEAASSVLATSFAYSGLDGSVDAITDATESADASFVQQSVLDSRRRRVSSDYGGGGAVDWRHRRDLPVEVIPASPVPEVPLAVAATRSEYMERSSLYSSSPERSMLLRGVPIHDAGSSNERRERSTTVSAPVVTVLTSPLKQQGLGMPQPWSPSDAKALLDASWSRRQASSRRIIG